MADSTLFPPNSRWLSDKVIGSVHQRLLDNKQKREYDDNAAAFEPRSQASSQDLFRPREGPTSAAHRPSDGQYPQPRAIQKDNYPLTRRPQEGPQASEEGIDKLHRERRRLTQIRYRTKLRNHADALETKVQVLREQVQKLELQLQINSPRLIEDTTSWKVVAEYFRIFRFAMTAYAPVMERCSPSSPGVYETHMHRDFLRKTMAPGVLIDDDNGVEKMLERWRLVSISQPNFEIKVVHLENGPDESILATTKINIVMCKSMLQHTFPNLDKSERGRRLAARLLGRPFEINGSIRFTWDSDKGCMLSLQHTSDVMMQITRFLGDLDDVAFVFDQQYSKLLARRLLTPSA